MSIGATLSFILFVALCSRACSERGPLDAVQASFVSLGAAGRWGVHRICSPVVCPKRDSTLLLLILLCGDIHPNPGPRQANRSVYPCGLCEHPVSWNCRGVCCDGCDIWHHKSCIELCSKDYELLQCSHAQWLCCKCESINVDSFSFRSYELDSNFFSPIENPDITIESIHSNFSPMKTSSPLSNHNTSKSRASTNSPTRSSTSSVLKNNRNKQNLRVINVNCRSIKDKKSEFAACMDYLKADIICGTESWLQGYTPGENPTQNAIKSSEVFPPEYVAHRNDRSTLGGGVFVLTRREMIVFEKTELVTDCEIVWVNVKIKGNKDLYIGSFYMPHRNMKSIAELEKSLDMLADQGKHIILCGDFNCPDIDWSTKSLNQNCADRQVQQSIIDLTTKYNLSQVHETPTRGENLLDLVFTNTPSLLKCPNKQKSWISFRILLRYPTRYHYR